VIYVGTFSKTLFPALRLAYLVLPRALVRPFLAAKWAADRFSATLAQAALAEFIAGGHFERYLRRASGRNAARRRTLIEALRQHFGERMEVAGEDAGVHLLVWLNKVAPRGAAVRLHVAKRSRHSRGRAQTGCGHRFSLWSRGLIARFEGTRIGSFLLSAKNPCLAALILLCFCLGGN